MYLLQYNFLVFTFQSKDKILPRQFYTTNALLDSAKRKDKVFLFLIFANHWNYVISFLA